MEIFVWDLKDLVYNLIVFLYIVIFFFLRVKKKILENMMFRGK